MRVWRSIGILPWLLLSLAVHAADRPNILVIMADDIGYWNVGAYSHGMMVPTPNIDRIAREGMLFTDHYGEPSCTAGRAAFITGQMPIRTGLTTVGQPGDPIGLSEKDPTIAEVLKRLGYRTGQFGKNHLGDRNEFLPTVHGFDEFYGNLYHMNAEEEPEQKDWPKTPGFDQRYRPRGVLRATASSEDDATVDPRFGKVGRQKIQDTGPLTSKRMETVDGEFTDAAFDFMDRAAKSDKPFFVWLNTTRMHIYTHLGPESRYLAQPYSSDYDIYGSGMMELDQNIGRILEWLDSRKLAENTIVIFTTDNGAMVAWWPDAGATPFRGEKATTWEGGLRVPMLVRWPGKIKPGSVSNDIQSHLDLLPTLAAAAGNPNAVAELRRDQRVHLDGVNNLAHWLGKAPSARNSFIYYNERELTAVRVGPWKGHFKTREGFFDWNRPSALLFNLRMDPFERQDGHRSELMAMQKAWIGGLFRDVLGEHMKSLKEFPPRQRGGSLIVEVE